MTPLINKSAKIPSVVGYLVDFEKSEITLGLRKSSSVNFGLELIDGIGGKVGDEEAFKNESSDEALIREFQEEVQVRPVEFHNLGEVSYIFPLKPKWSQVVQQYIITKWEGEPVETDVIKPVTYKFDAIPFAQMFEDQKYTLPHLLKQKHISGIFVYEEDNEKVKEFDLSVRSL